MDYKALGLKCGLEVHQQLDTGKLFIRTPSTLSDVTDFTIVRKLRPVASELGEYDKTALDAYKRNETFYYSGNKELISLVELDEEPPQPLDTDALKTVLEIALLCKSNPVNTIIPMRKTVIDGSNTSGFQRTCLASLGGELTITTNGTEKRIGVQTIVLEEDAARPIKKENGNVYYNLDRLGIPLIELATDPDVTTPEEAVELAKKIGEVMRLTCKTKRGKGTIRQDVNVSIVGGTRCEIKGCQELELIKVVVEKEAERQIDLLTVRDKLKNKFTTIEELTKCINTQGTEVTKVFATTEAKFIKGNKVFGLKLGKLKGMLGEKVGAKRFGSELSSYAKATGVSGLLHRDELPNYGLSEREVSDVAFLLGCNEEDNFILIVSEKERALKAFESVKERILVAYDRVPGETRGSLEDGSSEYQRPLSGEARMYPETDIPYKNIDTVYLNEIIKELPLTISARVELYKKLGLSTNHVEEMKLSNYARFFERLVSKGVNPTVAATTLLQTLTEMKRENILVEKLKEEQIQEVLLAEKRGAITKSQIKEIFTKLIKGSTLSEIQTTQVKVDYSALEKLISKLVTQNAALIKIRGPGSIGPLMGDLSKLPETKGVDGKILSDLLRKEIQKHLK